MITVREKLRLKKNRRRFDTLVNDIDSREIERVEETLTRIQRAVDFAVENDTGCFCSPEIETKLCEISQNLPDRKEKSPLPPGTILHVMTTAYRSGGHTRMVERWIANSPTNELHSVVLISQEPMHFPSHIEELVNSRGGQIIQLPPMSLIEKGTILRSLSRDASKIILHVHMYDPVPTLAYGSSSFTVPVIFFNHADHLFWIGASITDLCAEMSSWRCEFSRRRRGISRTSILTIPTDNSFIPVSREEARKVLGITTEDQVIVTSAQEYKYGHYRELDFFSFLLRITIGHPERIVLALGPSSANPLWSLMQSVSRGRIKAYGQIPYEEIGIHLCSADLFIESFPFPSFTSLLDVANLGIPTLSLRLPLPHLDSIEASGTICESIDELCNRVDSTLKNPPPTKTMIDSINRYHRRDGWLNQLKELYLACPAIHKVNDLSAVSLDCSIGDLETYLHYLKGNLRGDHVALLKRQAKLFFEILRLMVRFSLFNIPCLLVLLRHIRKSLVLLLSTIPKVIAKCNARNEKKKLATV
jgi:hypothetical protein